MEKRDRLLRLDGGPNEARQFFSERNISHIHETKSLIIFGWTCEPRDNPAIGARGYECARSLPSVDHATACIAGDYLMDCHVAAQLLENRQRPGLLFPDRIELYMGDSRLAIAQRMVVLSRVDGQSGWMPIADEIRNFFAQIAPDVGPAFAATARVFDATLRMVRAVREIEKLKSEARPTDGNHHKYWTRQEIDRPRAQ